MAVSSVLGGQVAWHVEYDKAPSRILAHHYPDVPNYGDVTAVDFTTIEPVDVLTGGYPCQPFSHAGLRKGTDDDRHLWPHVLRAIREMGPRLAILENVRGHLSLGFDVVLADLADLGWSARWGVVRASDAGACHQRARLFIIAYPDSLGHERAGAHGTGGADLRTTVAQLPTPTARDWKGHNQRGDDSCLAGALLPTPTSQAAKHGELSPVEREGNRPQDNGNLWVVMPRLTETALLPTPAVNDMGEGKTLEWWDDWAPRQKSSDGRPAPHGKSLAIEALRASHGATTAPPSPDGNTSSDDPRPHLLSLDGLAHPA